MQKRQYVTANQRAKHCTMAQCRATGGAATTGDCKGGSKRQGIQYRYQHQVGSNS